MPATRLPRPIEILLVEDSPTDRLITTEALTSSKLINSLHVVENGVDAMAYLRRLGKFKDARRPDLILLDLNLPKKDGREVLAEIKGDPLLKFIPVVVLTTSQSDQDLLRAYGNHANSYITKPVDFPQFSQALRALGDYWFEVVTLPSEATIERAARSEPPAPLSAGPVEGTVRVLLVEDSPGDAEMLRETLRRSPIVKFVVNHVGLVEDARARLRSQSFDLVVTDLDLPDSQGLATYRAVRSAAAGVPILVLTGLDDEAIGTQALREGADDYLVKGQLTARGLARAARYAIEKKDHQEQLRRSQQLEAVGRLAAGVAHDFNNILAVVRGNAELLVSADAPVVTTEIAQDIVEAADRAISLSRQLLTFSRKQSMQPKPLDLNQVVGDFTRMLRRILGEAVRLELQLAAELPAVLADTGMLEQVLLNLGANARDAMPGGGKLGIQTATVDVTAAMARTHPDAYPGLFACLRVTDTGAGMSPEVLARIFEPFFTTKALAQGTGLGLANVYGIVQQHRGWLSVTSRVGFGTKFEIFLPTTEAKPRATPSSRPAPRGRPSETILLVEDEPALRELTTKVLRHEGYTVLEAGTVAEALAVWGEHAEGVDLLFSDMVLPDGQTGRQLAERLWSIRPGLKVVFTSGYSSDFGAENFALDEGVNFLQKPYPLDRLLRTLRRRLDAAPASSR